MAGALERHEEITTASGEPMNPTLHVTLHVTLHGVVANQPLADDPPETWQTVQRLARLGYDWHNVMHMIMELVSEDFYRVMAQCHSACRRGVSRRGVEADFSHAGAASTGAFGVDVAFMLLERHERGIHAVWAGRGHGSRVTEGCRERRRTRSGAGHEADRPDQLRLSGIASRGHISLNMNLSSER